MKRFALLLLCLVSFAHAGEGDVSIVLRDVRLVDLVRLVFGDVSREPFMLSKDFLDSTSRVGVDLPPMPKAKAVEAVRELVEAEGFSVSRRKGVVWVEKGKEPAEDVVIYRPRYRSALYLADVVQSVTGARSVLSRSLRNQEGPQAVQPSREPVQGGAPRQVSPTSVEGQIDRSEVDQIAFTVAAKDAGKVRKLLADLDTSAGEVILKAAVYEVGVDRLEGSAIKIAGALMQGRVAVDVGSVLSGASYRFALGGIDAVLSALDSDVRFKSISRPQIRVRNGAQAKFSVGQDVPVLGQVQTDKAGNPLQSIDYKQSGVIFTATPEIRQDVIELNMHQELSNFVVTKTGVNNSPTLIKRSVDTRLGLVPGEVVVLAGLQEDQEDSSANRLPWIGWLLGQQEQKKQSEILVFIEAVKL